MWHCRCTSPRCRGVIAASFFDVPPTLQREYLPLLDAWFVEEHHDKIEALRKILKENT